MGRAGEDGRWRMGCHDLDCFHRNQQCIGVSLLRAIPKKKRGLAYSKRISDCRFNRE
jgi:hypothetical protein